ncbi:radical SAM protein [Synergistes jonesii]|uniref:Radical SAM core domain-containing protein n=1 Tax=Synergistes jonesii TaxID=2754 RepID=A0A073ITG2_9BACT|nr:radical SAM protein [Synergistes jonesii]KEJ93039.1 hypothetical protein EH55_12080 [Synergistes jonesii]OFB60831.1 hypothetical protein JS72_12820 [Synergistes jonesii]OFB64672.1 hypothetical protein JS73_02065 [Synergistes jonesii]OFB65973.1 hypothetical protein JS79_02070 [Synergistes jonesii]OFB68832.1 hypothetical protein JS78_02070 [Synergistes jonesii]
MVTVARVKVKSLLSPTKLGSDFVINPYIGCPHGCVYCYAAEIMRAHRGRAEPWGSYLDVKLPSAPFDLAKLFRKSILLSSMTDAYNPYEEHSLTTRGILRALLPAQPSISIITKSALVVRDIDILKEFPSACVTFSFSSLDDEFRKRAEPYASSPQKKLAAMAALQSAGIETNVMCAPLFPAITDCATIINAVKPLTSHITFDALKLRRGNAEKILSFVNSLHPELKELYEEIYLRRQKDFWEVLRLEIKRKCAQEGIRSSVFFGGRHASA